LPATEKETNMPTSPYSFGRFAATLLVLAAAGGAHADDDKSITRQLIEADGKVALKKLNQDLGGTAPPAAVSAAPAGAAEAKTRERSPKPSRCMELTVAPPAER
ncbi:hypothetical protein OMK73_03405, partial [Cupriavidus sp. D39]|nr:hypothetical protein [Cupriavidus sp. D39]